MSNGTAPFQYSGDRVLDVMSRKAINRNNDIAGFILRYARGSGEQGAPVRVLDFGAGRGEFAVRIAKEKNIEMSVYEIDGDYCQVLSKQFRAYKAFDEMSGKFDIIYSIDVMEHIENDTEVLIKLKEYLTDEGYLLLYLPARMELYSRFDREIGHHRRYDLTGIRKQLRTAGYRVAYSSYHDMFGYPAAWYNKMTYKGTFNETAVSIYDRFMFPCSRFIEKLFCPIGKSIVLAAKKT